MVQLFRRRERMLLSLLALVLVAVLLPAVVVSNSSPAEAQSGPAPPGGRQLLRNASFNNGFNDWWSSGVQITPDAGSVCIAVPGGRTSSHHAVGQNRFSLTQGKTYRIAAKMSADRPTAVTLDVQDGGSSFEFVRQDASVTTTPRNNTFEFVASRNERGAVLTMHFGGSGASNICVEHISLREMSDEVTPPPATPTATPTPTATATPTTPPPLSSSLRQWDESATWSEFNSTLGLAWTANGGDWLDADNNQGGSRAFSTVDIVDDNAPGLVEMNVLPVIQQTGEADFFVRMTGGVNYKFHSREGSGAGPKLVLNGSLTVPAAADTWLDQSTFRSLGNEPTVATNGGGMLIRFTLPANVDVTQASLQLTSTGAEFGNQTLHLFVPDPQFRIVERPSWLSVDPTVIASFDGTDVLRDDLPVTASNGIATSQLRSPDLTWISSNMTIPNQTQACATVYQKLGTDFRPGGLGGKHPGFANTGITVRGDDVVNGVTYPDSSWGGRSPDGVHWSARTSFGDWTDTHVEIGTYMYAMAPHNSYGWIESLGSPFPKGEWTAYVQCVKLNTVSGSTGNNDGKIYYEVAGVGGVYSREDVRWRDIDAPESEIREFWINYYCGGTDCGDIANRGTVSFAGAVVTRGMPNMSAVNAEVARLNRDHP